MKDELFTKVYIHSVDDLPKEDGSYIVHSKTGEIYQTVFMQMVKEAPIYWKLYDWYLQPIEQPLADQPEKPVMTAREYIVKEWGESWLTNDWESGDVMDALEEYASQKPRELTDQDLPSELETFEKLIDKFFKEHSKEEILVILKKYDDMKFEKGY